MVRRKQDWDGHYNAEAATLRESPTTKRAAADLLLSQQVSASNPAFHRCEEERAGRNEASKYVITGITADGGKGPEARFSRLACRQR